MGFGRDRNRQCPCGSGRKSKDCCLVGSQYVKQEATLTPPFRRPVSQTRTAISACHLDCSTTLSREHFVSEGILRELSGGRRQVWVAGVPFLADGEHRFVASSSIAAKVLCIRHNNALAPLDAEALRLFRILRRISDGRIDPNSHSCLAGAILRDGCSSQCWAWRCPASRATPGASALVPSRHQLSTWMHFVLRGSGPAIFRGSALCLDGPMESTRGRPWRLSWQRARPYPR